MLDLAMLLPAAILGGALLMRRGAWGYVLVPVILVAIVFISLGIVSFTIVVAVVTSTGPWPSVGVAMLALVELVVVVRLLAGIVVPGDLHVAIIATGDNSRMKLAQLRNPLRHSRAIPQSVDC